MEEGERRLPPGVRQGDVLDGKYRIDRIIGSGGMGVVVAAQHVQLNDKVAIKLILPEKLHDEEAVARFAREARAVVKIKNEHVARVIDVGTLESGAPYMVMEYLDGIDLAAWVLSRGALPVEQAVELVLQASEALAEAHRLGIVHRDLKPANLFVVRRADGLLSVKVLDFGISKVSTQSFSESDAGMTTTAKVMGSPKYMSPEQMHSSRDVDARTDIWAIGVILYELLAGTPPFRGASLPELCVKIATQGPPPLRTYRPDAPLGLERIILKCIEKDRKARYRNVAELAAALVGYAPKRAAASVEKIVGTIQAPGWQESDLELSVSSVPMVATTSRSWGATSSAPRGRNKAAWSVAAMAVAVGGSLAFLIMKPALPPPAPSTAAPAPVPSLAPVVPVEPGGTPEVAAEQPKVPPPALAYSADSPSVPSKKTRPRKLPSAAVVPSATPPAPSPPTSSPKGNPFKDRI